MRKKSKNLLKLFLLINFITLFIYSSISFAVEERKIENKEERIKKLDTLTWYNWDDPKNHIVTLEKANVELDILEHEYYLKGNKDINQYSWWTFGKPSDGEDLVIFGGTYTVYINFIDEGYVTLDDWKSIDTDVWIKEMRNTAKTNAEIFKKQKLDYVENIDWISEPEFDDKNNNVNYSYEVLWNDGVKTLESKNILLGRKGYLGIVFVFEVTPDTNLVQEANFSKEFVQYINFKEGSRHEDYKSGDKVAAIGIGGLVAGTLGVKALAKAGILAKFLPLLAKFWWIILAPIAAIFGFARKKSSPTVPSSGTERKPRRRRKK